MTALYVAGSSRERPRYREAIHGVRVTYDWESGYQAHEIAEQAGDVVAAARIFGAARRNCIDGVSAATAFVLLIPETPSKGAWLETGLAIAQKQTLLYSVGDADLLDIWGPCFDQHFDTMDECLAHLRIERSAA